MDGRRPVTQGPWGALAYSCRPARRARKAAQLQGQRGKALATHPPSHRSRVRLHSEESDRSRVVTSSAAASDDAVHAVRVLRREVADCWRTHAYSHGRNSVTGEAQAAD
jgi:hypothetical protein